MLQVEKSTAQKYFEKNFQNPELEWKNIYTLRRHVTINTNLHIFQCKLLRNILYLNEMLYKSGKTGLIFFFLLQKQTFFGSSYSILSKMH